MPSRGKHFLNDVHFFVLFEMQIDHFIAWGRSKIRLYL